MLVAQLIRFCPPLLSRSTSVHTLTWNLPRLSWKSRRFTVSTSKSTMKTVTGYSQTMLRSRRCHGEMGDRRETQHRAPLQEALTSQG